MKVNRQWFRDQGAVVKAINGCVINLQVQKKLK
jgi:hypothetical protein